MKASIFPLLLIVLFSAELCPAQPPQWVQDLVDENLDLQIDEISYWDEREATFHDIDGTTGNADSIVTNVLYVEGATTNGDKFFAVISQTDHVVIPLGLSAVVADSCTSMCGCQCCKAHPSTPGCFCNTAEFSECCVDQQDPHCNCWCQHQRSTSPN